MRKIIFHLSVGFAGMDATDNGTFPDDVTDEELNDEAWYRAIQHAESYGYYPASYLEEENLDGLTDDEAEEISEQYIDSIDGYWEDYDPEKHDGLAAGGGEWVWQED